MTTKSQFSKFYRALTTSPINRNYIMKYDSTICSFDHGRIKETSPQLFSSKRKTLANKCRHSTLDL